MSPRPAVVTLPRSGSPSLDDCLKILEQDFVWIPPGRFLMGCPSHEAGQGEEEMEHEVELTRGFFLQRVAVTQGLWQAVMGANPSCFKGEGSDLPVEGISWQDCLDFIPRLDDLTGCRHRLPTEAEWEYACRADSFTAFANGRISRHHCEPDPVLEEIGWYCGNSGRRPHPVGSKVGNGWGLFDMHGNVWEWCSDWHGPAGMSPQRDPTGPRAGTKKVIRGGSWFSTARNCRSAARFSWEPQASSDMIGFRLVRSGNQPSWFSPRRSANTLGTRDHQR